MSDLSAVQRKAIAYVRERALARGPAARAALGASLRAASVTEAEYRDALDRLRAQARVALALHPERLTRRGISVAEGLLLDGVYRNQFETGLSSGSTSPYAGGERDEWERRLFGGAYHGGPWCPVERPKYGALFLVAHPDGPAPRFGSCYFVLRPEVSERCTFTFLGSQDDGVQERLGTLDALDPVVAALLDHVAEEAVPLGVDGLTVRTLLQAMRAGVPCTPPGVSTERPGRALDSFVEAQVHGPVDLRNDVEALFVDPSLRGTREADTLAELASRFDITLGWHPGFSLPAGEVPEEFRGYPVRRLAERIAPGGVIHAAAIGAAANDFMLNPEAWVEFGSASEIRTCFRRLWHVLVLAG